MKCDFSGVQVEGQELTESQRQFLIASYLTEIQGTEEVYVNTVHLQEDLAIEGTTEKQRRKSIDEEQMLDIAEMCFVKIADQLIKMGITVKEAFARFAIPEVIPETKQLLELLVPEAFL